MARVKVFAEIEVRMDLDVEGLDASTPEHEVQQHRPDVLAALEAALTHGFGTGNFKKLDYMEFDVERDADTGSGRSL